MATVESQYTKEECKVIELEQICLICREQNKHCEWIENEENGCYTFCCTTCYLNKDTDDTGYWGMRGCCKCGEETRHNLIMSTCVCEKYFNLCLECAIENKYGEWFCGEGDCRC